MGSYRTKKDDVARISTSVYITNFPEATSAKELFQACNQYGHVVDSFIPNKKSKIGKRFGFVTFINVFSEERLISNLCTVWMDRFKIHANIARFQRYMVKKERVGAKKPFVVPTPTDQTKNIGKQSDVKSYKGVLNGIKNKEIEIMNSAPSIVLGEECVMSNKILNAVFGRVNEFVSLANLKLALANEGFMDIVIKYMGELWVMLEFKSASSVLKFKKSIGAMSWFSQGQRGKVYWIRASETPGWVPDFTNVTEDNDINSMDEGDVKHKPEDSDINNDEEKVLDTCFEEEEEVKSLVDEKNSENNLENSEEPFNIQSLFNRHKQGGQKDNISNSSLKYPPEEEEVKSPVDEKNSENNLENSEDPFNIQSLLNCHKQGGKKDNISDSSLKYPPGFTLIARDTVEVRPDNIVEANDAQSECCEANKLKGNGNSSISSGHFKVYEASRSGGSMIGLLEEVVKVGQVMGFKMDGCISNMEEIIGSQGVEDGYR
nr:nucleotide-binding alpha-beta plait domain-containing protein [Tanacetum cinerariifolium]